MTSVGDLIGADGANGEPGMLTGSAARIDRAGDDIERLRARLAALDGMQWRGLARARYDKLKDQTIQGDLAPFVGAYDAASQALRRYAHQLADIQSRARALARQINAADAQTGEHQRDANLAEFGVNAAHAATIVTGLSPVAQQAAQFAHREARAHHARMQAQLAESRRHAARLRAQGHALHAELDAAAATCAGQVNALTPPGQHPLAAAAAAITAIGAVNGRGGRSRRPGGGPARSIDLGPDAKQRERWNATRVTRGRDFAQQYDGARLDFDGVYGAQCVDVFSYYNRDVAHGPRIGCESAYQLYDIYGATSSYEKLPPSAVASDGDVAIYGSGLQGSGGHGHVAIVIEDRGDKLYVFHQNWPSGSGGHYQEISKSALLGYLRPTSVG